MEEVEVDEMLKTGFNHGFILAKEKPDLYLKQLNSIRGNPLYKQGFEKGKEAFIKMDLKEKSKKKKKGKGLGR